MDGETYNNLMAEHGFIPANHVEPNWFDVGLEPLFDGDQNPVDGFKRIVNKDTGKTIKVHTDAYKLISYEECFDAFDAALNSSGLDTTDMHIATDLTHDGGRCFRQYMLPAHRIKVKDRDLALRIIMFNSYDGSMAFRGMCGAYEFVCANTSVFGKHLVKVNVKHTKNAEIAPVIESIVGTADNFMTYQPRFESMIDVTPSERTAYALLEDGLNANEMHRDHIFTQWRVGEDQSLYGLWAKMTSWSTHGLKREGNYAASRTERENAVSACIEADEWLQVEAA